MKATHVKPCLQKLPHHLGEVPEIQPIPIKVTRQPTKPPRTRKQSLTTASSPHRLGWGSLTHRTNITHITSSFSKTNHTNQLSSRINFNPLPKSITQRKSAALTYYHKATTASLHLKQTPHKAKSRDHSRTFCTHDARDGLAHTHAH